jgi:hypothetical protein
MIENVVKILLKSYKLSGKKPMQVVVVTVLLVLWLEIEMSAEMYVPCCLSCCEDKAGTL